jgi:glutathione S-transferase
LPPQRLTDLPILYSFRRCPYAMRARMALLVSGTTCELREVKLREKPAEMIAISPKATVPVLLAPDGRPDGRVIDQSVEIMHWALARHDPEHWLDSANDPLIATNDGAFKFHLDRYKYPDRHDSDALEHRAVAVVMLETLERRLEGAANLARPARSLVDMAVMPFIRQFANTDRAFFDALNLPKVQIWLATHIASPLFETAMLIHPRWTGTDAEPTYLEMPVNTQSHTASSP